MQFFKHSTKYLHSFFTLKKKESLKNANVAAKVTFYDGTSSLAPPFFCLCCVRNQIFSSFLRYYGGKNHIVAREEVGCTALPMSIKI